MPATFFILGATSFIKALFFVLGFIIIPICFFLALLMTVGWITRYAQRHKLDRSTQTTEPMP